MVIFPGLRQFILSRRAAIERRRTLDMVNALPLDIQKDIGWPGFMPESQTGRYAGARRRSM